MSETGKIPRSAALLGYGGLIPFIGSAFGAVMLPVESAEMAQGALLAYAAVILSFLGGILWGRSLGLKESDLAPNFIVSVLPSLAGWAALLIGGAVGLWVCAAGLALMLAHDLNDRGTVAWFRRLRLHLSLGAIACCAFAALFG